MLIFKKKFIIPQLDKYIHLGVYDIVNLIRFTKIIQK